MTGKLEQVARIVSPGAWAARDQAYREDWPFTEKGLADALVQPSIAKATAILQAMREPTPAMIGAGEFVMNVVSQPSGTTEARAVPAPGEDSIKSYRRMIDAALAEPPPSRERVGVGHAFVRGSGDTETCFCGLKISDPVHEWTATEPS